MGSMGYSLLGVMQDFYHQLYIPNSSSEFDTGKVPRAADGNSGLGGIRGHGPWPLIVSGGVMGVPLGVLEIEIKRLQRLGRRIYNVDPLTWDRKY